MPDMKLVSMKLDKSARDQMTEPSSLASDGPLYPWGLSVTLDEEALDKLQLDLPKVGTTVVLVARADVTSVSSNEGQDRKPRRSVSLQITDLAVDADEPGDKPEAQDVLYQGKKKG